MNNIIQTIRHTARAATVLLLALLAAQTAGAQTNVSDAGGFAVAFGNTNVSVINVTDNITGVGILPSINRALTINLNGHTISGDGLHIDAFAGCSLTINGGGQGGSVGNIISGYANGAAINNNGGTVTLSHVNITTNSAYAIGSYGTLNIGNSVSFNGWTSAPFDTRNVNITGNYNYDLWNYNPFANVVATVTVESKTHYFENLSAALVYITNNAGKVDFSWSKSDDTYTIHTATGWGYFCDLLEGGETFSDKTIVLAGDIGTPEAPVTRMGSSTTQFQGTFDGAGHTLTVQYGTPSEPVNQQFVAPFPVVAGGATFRNLIIAGSIYVDYTTTDENPQPGVGGLIGHLFGGVTIEGCTSTVEITSTRDRVGGFVGLCEHSVSFTDCVSSAVVHYSSAGNISGFVGWSRASEYTISFEGCLFNGKLLLDNGQWYGGGFVGWKGDGKTVNITNCLYAPPIAADEEYESGGATFCIQHNDQNPAVITNGYYTHTLGAAQGKQARAVTAGTDVTVAHAGVATHYATSGITAYKATGASTDSDLFIAGLLYNNNVADVLYAGSDEVVSLTLSNTAPGDVPDGYQYGYTTNAGTLEGSTLTMPDQDVTVSLALTVLPWSGDGTESSPYIIYNKDQLDLLAHRVNGTHGETRQEDGYYNTYFQLNNDIKYTPSDEWNDFDSHESNYEAIGGYYGGNRYFRGHFDGNNKTISGIRIYKGGSGNADRFQGIFGRTNSGADIHDLTLADARITGYDNTGGIVGENNVGTVSGCHVAADVAVCAVQSSAWDHGGIVGSNSSGTIEQCTSAATLTTADAANSRFYGGIAGYNSSRGTLHDNLAIGATVPAAKDNSYGAITGYNNDGSLQRNYYAACKVNDTPNATGVGCGHIDDGNGGYTTADVNNVNNPNGAVSIHTLTLADGITTTTAATVTIGTTGYYAQGTAIALSYSGTTGEGYQLAIVSNDGNGSNAATADGSGNYTAVMPAADATAKVTVTPWDGDGTEGSPYIIEYASQLDLLAHRVNGTHGETCQEDGYENKFFQLAKDISYPHKANDEEGADTESNYEAIGGYYGGFNRYFRGHFDGNNKTISGIRIYKDGTGYADYYQGIFGWTVSGADIHDLTLADARITGYNNTGGIVGYNKGTVSGCHVAGDVAVCAVQSNAYRHGGIVGLNTGTIEQCTSAVTLTIDANSQSYGGIAGYNGGTLRDNLAIGATVPATADNSYGAITGRNDGSLLRNYYAACKVADVENATGVGCGYIGNDDDGYTTADVNNDNYPDGAVCINTLALTANLAPDGNYWTTYYNSFLGFTIDADENACAYTATYGAGQLTLHKLGKEIPAGTAVIIVADNDEVSMTAATDLDDISDVNDLRGVNTDTPTSALGTGTFYVLGMTTVGNEQHFGFHRYTGSEMAAHKAFVHVSGTNQARSLTMVFDEATDIESAEADSSLFTLHSSLSTWFTLDGRRLQAKPTVPGIYINNGKKVVIK